MLSVGALRRVLAPLLELFGVPKHAFDLVLTLERTLVREDNAQVLCNFDEQDYHLQMPLPKDECLQYWSDQLLHCNDPV